MSCCIFTFFSEPEVTGSVCQSMMDTAYLNKKFLRMGARVKFQDPLATRPRIPLRISLLDIQEDRRGEYFEITLRSEAEPQVLDLQPEDRHLLLLIREEKEKYKFLCGHDERHWFVAAIPEKAPVGTVRQAKEALKPHVVRVAQSQKKLANKSRNRRKNAAFIRQGEWFFLPVSAEPDEEMIILQNEPLMRGNGGKAHWAEFCVRTGGEAVLVCNRYRSGLSLIQYQRLIEKNSNARTWNWRAMRRNPEVYVKGRIRHPDHKTILLPDWHRVVMNTETQSRAMRNVAFLD